MKKMKAPIPLSFLTLLLLTDSFAVANPVEKPGHITDFYNNQSVDLFALSEDMTRYQWGYEYNYTNEGEAEDFDAWYAREHNRTHIRGTEVTFDFGIDFETFLDLSVGFPFAKIWYMEKDEQDWLSGNAELFFELAWRNWVTFLIGFMEIRLNFNFTGWRGTPLDF
jgi:hypothetical protein